MFVYIFKTPGEKGNNRKSLDSKWLVDSKWHYWSGFNCKVFQNMVLSIYSLQNGNTSPQKVVGQKCAVLRLVGDFKNLLLYPHVNNITRRWDSNVCQVILINKFYISSWVSVSESGSFLPMMVVYILHTLIFFL